jgi:hypothetical protein
MKTKNREPREGNLMTKGDGGRMLTFSIAGLLALLDGGGYRRGARPSWHDKYRFSPNGFNRSWEAMRSSTGSLIIEFVSDRKTVA